MRAAIRQRLALAPALIGALAAPLQGHDFWIAPSAYRVAPETAVTLRLMVGDRFRGEALARDPRQLVRFAAVFAGDRDRERAIPGRPGSDPAGVVRLEEPGLTTIVYRSRGAIAELAPEAFAGYLEEEGLAPLLASPPPAHTVREHFSRCAKTLIAVGDAAERPGYDRPVGLDLELVPLADPYALAAGDTLPMRLLLRGAPAAGVRVAALHHDRPETPVMAVTDDQGEVALALPRAGPWLIKAVWIEPAAAGDIDYRSLWASLTFTLGAS